MSPCYVSSVLAISRYSSKRPFEPSKAASVQQGRKCSSLSGKNRWGAASDARSTRLPNSTGVAGFPCFRQYSGDAQTRRSPRINKRARKRESPSAPLRRARSICSSMGSAKSRWKPKRRRQRVLRPSRAYAVNRRALLVHCSARAMCETRAVRPGAGVLLASVNVAR